jgi:hypothetical protein
MPFIENSEEYDLFETLKVYEETIEDKLIIAQIHNDVQRLVNTCLRSRRKCSKCVITGT